MPDALQNALIFLIESIFNIYLFILVIRLIMVWVRSDYFNPVSQFTMKATNIMVMPVRRFLPSFGQLETSTLVLLILLECVKFFLLMLINSGFPNLLGIFILSIADILYLIIQTFTYAIILQAVLSLVQPGSFMMPVLYRFTSPIMQPIQRILPPIGGFDLSPIPALIILQLLNIVLVSPLMSLGQSMLISY